MSKRKSTREDVKIDTEKINYEEVSGQEDLFHRLPQELHLSILSWVADLKSLFQFSLVSKHLASLVSRVRTVSVTVPSSGAHTKDSFENMRTLLRELHLASAEQIPATLESLSLQNLKLPKFLENFREVESIYLEYTHPRNGINSSFPKWKVKCAGGNVKIDNFVALNPASLHKHSEVEQAGEEASTEFLNSQLNDCFWPSYGRYVEWLCLICMVVKSHTSLKSVTITDSEKQGQLVMRDEQLAKTRWFALDDEIDDLIFKSTMKVAWIPTMYLPLSRYFMRGVCLIILDAHDEEDDKMISWDFEDDEKLLGEAITEIVKHHRDRIMSSAMY